MIIQVPQWTVIGPIAFLVDISGLPEKVKELFSSSLHLHKNHQNRQDDINGVAEWEKRMVDEMPPREV